MPFDITPRTEKKSFQRTVFLSLDLGQHIIRFLQPSSEAYKTYIHFLQNTKISIKCLGDDCPICENNRRLYLQNPKNAGKIAGYVTRSTRYFMNVLDKTLVKTCPNIECQFESTRNTSGQFPDTCPKCSTFLSKEVPHPCGKVKVYSFGEENAGQINGYEVSNLDASGNPIPVTEYDFMLMTTKTSDRKSTIPSPLYNNNEKVEIANEFLFDLTKAVITLTRDEVNDLLRGVSLRDIFAAKRNDVVEETTTELVKNLEDVERRVAELLE